jgi:hypothetical protein
MAAGAPVDKKLHSLGAMIPVGAHFEIELHRTLHQIAFERRHQGPAALAYCGNHLAPIHQRLLLAKRRQKAYGRAALDRIHQHAGELVNILPGLFGIEGGDHVLS